MIVRSTRHGDQLTKLITTPTSNFLLINMQILSATGNNFGERCKGKRNKKEIRKIKEFNYVKGSFVQSNLTTLVNKSFLTSFSRLS